MRKISLSLLGWLLLASSAAAGNLRVMTWDIEDAYPHDKFPILAKVIQKYHVDLVALQNVQTQGDRTHEIIQAELDKLYGPAVFDRDISGRKRFDDQVCFWNTRTVKVFGAEEYRPLEMGNHYRAGQILRARAGKFDFDLINVNLFEGITDEDEEKVEQAGVLRKLIEARGAGGRHAVILAGNLNMSFPDETIYNEISDQYEAHDNPAYRELTRDGAVRFTTRDLAKRKAHNNFSYIGDWLQGGRLLDHIAANTAAWRRYIHGTAKVVRVDREFFKGTDDYEWNFSDHLPLIADFKTD